MIALAAKTSSRGIGGGISNSAPRLSGESSASSVFRFNVFTGYWVVFAQARRDRPIQTTDHLHIAPQKVTDAPKHEPSCPFCEGNESMTPPTLLKFTKSGLMISTLAADIKTRTDTAAADVVREPPVSTDNTSNNVNNNNKNESNSKRSTKEEDKTCDETDWSLRVCWNKYPAVSQLGNDPTFSKYPHLFPTGTLMDEMPAVGHHEVIIETPTHNAPTALRPVEDVENLVHAWKERGICSAANTDIRQVLYFKNQGAVAGASLVHPHSQLVGLPVIPQKVLALQDIARRFYEKHEESVYEKVLQAELELANNSDVHRIIDVNSHFVSFVPFASFSPFYVTVMPRFDSAHFLHSPDDILHKFAELLHLTLRRIHICLDQPDYNLVIRSAPLPNRGAEAAYNHDSFYRWHASVLPKLGSGSIAGFEYGSGIYSNANVPEEDAEKLRSVDLTQL